MSGFAPDPKKTTYGDPEPHCDAGHPYIQKIEDLRKALRHACDCRAGWHNCPECAKYFLEVLEKEEEQDDE